MSSSMDISNNDLSNNDTSGHKEIQRLDMPVLRDQFNNLKNLIQKDYNNFKSSHDWYHKIQAYTGILNYSGDPLSLLSILGPNISSDIPWYVPLIIQGVNLCGTYIDGYIRKLSTGKKEALKKSIDLLQDIDRELRGSINPVRYDAILASYRALQ